MRRSDSTGITAKAIISEQLTPALLSSSVLVEQPGQRLPLMERTVAQLQFVVQKPTNVLYNG